MSGKKVTIGNKPTNKTTPASADQWVDQRSDTTQPMKRLTIDIPADLHRQIKTACAMRGTKIAEEVRQLLLEKYGNQ